MTAIHWSHNGNGNWTTASDWSSGTVPGSADDAFIGISGVTVTSSGSVTVNSVGVGNNAELAISSSSTFVATDGTGSSQITGTVKVNNGSDLEFVLGTVDNSGTIELDGTGAGASLGIDNNILLEGGGTIELSPDANNIIVGNSGGSILTNNDNVIEGSGLISNLLFINYGILETASPLGNGALHINANATGVGSFDNEGSVFATDSGAIEFGEDGANISVTNDNLIELINSSPLHTTGLEILGNVTFKGSGQIVLGGSAADDNLIYTDGTAATLNNADNTISGAAVVFDNHLAIVNAAVINANDPGENLTLDVKSITNTGTLEATNNGVLVIGTAVSNAGGTIDAAGGFIRDTAKITGGTVEIGQGGTLTLSGNGKTTGNVKFTSAGATLALASKSNTVGGNIVGFTGGDSIDAQFVGFNFGIHPVWQQTSSSGGTLSLYDNGTVLASFDLAGQYNSLEFTVGDDDNFGLNNGQGGTLITAQNTPSYAEPPGSNNDEWILANGQWAASAGPGSHPAGYNVAGVGDYKGAGTDGILWYDPATGDTDEWQLSKTQWSASVDLGTHPANGTDGASFQIAGTDGATNFTGNGIDDVLWTSPNSDGTIATDIWELGDTGKWTASVSPGNHPAGYAVAGTGDWTGNGTNGILWYNASNGDTDEWQLSGGKWAASVDLGVHPGNYRIAGIGDFFGNGRDGVLWTSVNSDGTVAIDIWELNASGQWMASVSPGNHPAGYQVVGVGDFTGTGTSDILWYNASTGDVDEWLINNGQWAGSVDLGTHPGNFQIAGVGDFNGDRTKDILWHSNT